MCLAVPMRLLEVHGDETGVAEFGTTRCTVNVSMVDQPHPGDFVIIHAGFAIEKLDEREACERIALFEQMAALASPGDAASEPPPPRHEIRR